jgi:sugar lactone lactonase YvrE
LLAVCALRAQDQIYWTDLGASEIRRSNLDGTQPQTVISGATGAFGLSLDLQNCKLYWTSTSNGRIHRANLDGSGVETVLSGLLAPGGVRPHIPGGWIYWTDSTLGTVSRVNLLGSIVQTLVSGMVLPIGIDVDEFNGKLYWVGSGAIHRSNLNGTGREVVVPGLAFPTSVAVDPAAGKVYWVDFTARKIQRANLNGSGVEDLLTNVDGGGLLGLDVLRRRISYAHFARNELRRIDMNGGADERIVGGIVLPIGIALALPLPGSCMPGSTSLAQTFGAGCGSGTALPEIGFVPGNLPTLGNPGFVVTLAGANPSAQAWFLWSSGVVPGGLPLGPCALYLEQPLAFVGPLQANGSGGLGLTFAVANEPALAGIDLYSQWMVTGNPGAYNGVDLSNGLHIRIGN